MRAAVALLFAGTASALRLGRESAFFQAQRANAELMQRSAEAEMQLNTHLAEFGMMLEKAVPILLQLSSSDEPKPTYPPKQDEPKPTYPPKKMAKTYDNVVSKPAGHKAQKDEKKAAVVKQQAQKAVDQKIADAEKKAEKAVAKVEKVEAKTEKAEKTTVKAVIKVKKEIKEPAFPPEMDAFKSQLAAVEGPAMMLPLLSGMYDQFKQDIKNNNKLEKDSAKRVEKYQKELDDLKKDPTHQYLLEEKERAVKYFKKQRDIQHRHYRAMLKMAHGMMDRIKGVEKMTKMAAEGKKLTAADTQQLQAMAPTLVF